MSSTPSEASTVATTNTPSITDLLFDASRSLEDTEATLMAFGAKQLRTECYLNQLRIVKKGPSCNDHKVGYVTLLLEHKKGLTEMQQRQVEGGPSKGLPSSGIKRRTRHCMIRLLNVMFSDSFANRVHEIDGKPTRSELDTSQTHSNSSFWTDFHTAYQSDQAEFSKLNSSLLTFVKCNPGIIIAHDAAKLREMWKDVSSRYTTALANSRVSGTHDNEFFSFCSGKIDVLYMHEWLCSKPGLLETVEGKLPKRARLQTMDTFSDSDGETECSNRSKKRCKKSPSKANTDLISEILTTIRDNTASGEALERDCRFAQIVSTLNLLLSRREMIVNARAGSYTDEDLQEVNEDIAHVRRRKKELMRD